MEIYYTLGSYISQDLLLDRCNLSLYSMALCRKKLTQSASNAISKMARVVSYGRSILDTILSQHGVNEVNHLPEDYLRDLCRRASQAEMQREFERTEEENPGRTAVVVGQDSSGNDVGVHSSDVGSEVIIGFLAEADDRADLLCDPQYNPVDFELRIFDTSPEAPVDPIQNVGHCVLSVTLQPPNFA